MLVSTATHVWLMNWFEMRIKVGGVSAKGWLGFVSVF